MQTKPKFHPNSPEIKAYQNEIAHQFVREGTMVAFPTCLPGMTTPIPLDESHITALDINSEGHVYGGTSGQQAHLFGAAFHGLTGIVLDAGAVPGCTSRPSRNACTTTGTLADLARSMRADRCVSKEWTPPSLTNPSKCTRPPLSLAFRTMSRMTLLVESVPS